MKKRRKPPYAFLFSRNALLAHLLLTYFFRTFLKLKNSDKHDQTSTAAQSSPAAATDMEISMESLSVSGPTDRDQDREEDMEEEERPRYSCKVPDSISFGRRGMRGHE
jgi:hypothetical protein